MRILLDECLPKRLKRDFVGHDVASVPEMGWAGMSNGILLAAAQTDFDVFVTVDRNLSSQHDVSRFNIAVVVLIAKSNALAALQPLIAEVVTVLGALSPGQVVRVGP